MSRTKAKKPTLSKRDIQNIRGCVYSTIILTPLLACYWLISYMEYLEYLKYGIM